MGIAISKVRQCVSASDSDLDYIRGRTVSPSNRAIYAVSERLCPVW